MPPYKWALVGLVAVVALSAAGARAQESEPIVKAVFFYSPDCQHCHKVISEDMPGISEQFGDSLLVVYVDVSSEQGAEYFNDAMDSFDIPGDERGVPAVVVGERLLVGEIDIPEQLPRIAESALAEGGLDWPNLPGMADLGSQAEALATEEAANPEGGPGVPGVGPAAAITGTNPAIDKRIDELMSTLPGQTRTAADLTLSEKLARDPVAFAIAILVLVALVVSAVVVGVTWFRIGLSDRTAEGWRSWVVPALSVAGLAAAAYLAYVETSDARAICGPVGDCNAVQQSPYATLFGVLPVGVLGVIGYLVILCLWAVQRFGSASLARRIDFALPSVVIFGVLFSIYLTFLEVFVIGAVCMWCITSAVIMGLLLWAVYRGWANRPPTRVEVAAD